ncbi:hypothetical protein EYF80_038291 [Liparis tanakae]|uniref:Uncharacterized protein n=1 Tax=Liparis tanakae TaxID=230148 RepID=A0A4Z2GDR9_9TELE|nr:hypothetical protein EYF80_038291 [Liparis tanakae]
MSEGTRGRGMGTEMLQGFGASGLRDFGASGLGGASRCDGVLPVRKPSAAVGPSLNFTASLHHLDRALDAKVW